MKFFLGIICILLLAFAWGTAMGILFSGGIALVLSMLGGFAIGFLGMQVLMDLLA